MREIVLDTETTGIDHSKGHRIVELGAVELVNHIPSGKTFHAYIDPERDMPSDAEAIHGLTTQFLKGKPLFSAIAGDFLAFIGEASLVIHNASFVVGFLNAEFARLNIPSLLPVRVVDTLMLARQKHPM
ncbi:MAG: exonuclease domain-containing protein, partial [Parvibaculaceae bacterium]